MFEFVRSWNDEVEHALRQREASDQLARDNLLLKSSLETCHQINFEQEKRVVKLEEREKEVHNTTKHSSITVTTQYYHNTTIVLL